jgi:biopolymer transport protein ExbD
MESRRRFLLMLGTSFVALAVVVAPVIADELFGVLTKVDIAGKKVTVEQKDTDKEVEITVTDDTEYVSGKGTVGKLDLEKIAKGIEKAKEKGKKGIPVVVTHDKKVASKIAVAKKKEAAPN